MSEDIAMSRLGGLESTPPRRRSRVGYVLFCLLLAFIGGIGATLWTTGVWQRWWSGEAQSAPARVAEAPDPAAMQGAATDLSVSALDARIAALSARLDSLSAQAMIAGSHATRAEAVLIAAAARRALDGGAALGYLEGELRARFGEAQPRAVSTVISAAAEPVTLPDLQSGLDALGPALLGSRPNGDWWTATRRELANLVIIRKTKAPSPAPEKALERARSLLLAGRVESAMQEVERLPGRSSAASWIDQARRYNEARRALDVIEAAAILDPRSAPAPQPTSADALAPEAASNASAPR